MKITSLFNIGPAAATEAWRLSREVDRFTSYVEIASVDAPVNEMPCAVLQFEQFTIIEREIMFTTRNHVAWSRTSRVDDPMQFEVPAAFDVDVELIKGDMATMAAAGYHQDHWRGYTPLLAYAPAWVARMSIRDMVGMHNYFNYLANRINADIWATPDALATGLRFANIAVAFANVISQITMYDIGIFPAKVDKYLCENYHDDFVDMDQMTTMGHFTTIQIDVPIMLRAQLVRHRPILFVDDFFDCVISPRPTSNMFTKVHMQCTAPTSFWQSIATKRACWISQWGLWEPVISALGGDASMLPCTDNKPCPCNVDNGLRLEGKDPSPPCPIWLKRNGRAFDRTKLVDYARDRQSFWPDEILGAL